MRINAFQAITAFLPLTVAQQTLKGLARTKGIYVGAAAENGELPDPTFAQILGEQFEATTPGNSMKWESVQKSQDVFTFEGGDQFMTFAKAKGLKVRGHTLVWHSQLPAWVRDGTWTRETLTAVIENHVTKTMLHWKGQLFHWDVVNEIWNDDGTLRDSVFSRVLGEDFVEIAFRAARAADPDAKLYINDYNIDGLSAKSTSMFNLVQKLLAKGVPIDGIGSQAHLIVGSVPTTYQANIEKFTQLGIDFAITELDIRMPTPATDAKIQQQAKDYEFVVKSCVAVPKCIGVTFWGYTDRYSWIPSTFPGEGAALLYDAKFNYKPAYNGVVAALGGTPVVIPVTTTTTPSATPTGVAIYQGAGIEAGWQNWGWGGGQTIDAYYSGDPKPANGGYAIKGTTVGYDGLSFKKDTASFADKVAVSFDVAGSALVFNAQLENTVTGVKSKDIPLTSFCTGTFSATSYIPCRLDLTTLPGSWDRLSIKSGSNTLTQTIFLANIWLVSPPPVVIASNSGTLIHVGAGLEPGWGDWKYNAVIDLFYTGEPKSVVGSYAVKGTPQNYGLLSFKKDEASFNNRSRVVFWASGDAPNYSVQLEHYEKNLKSSPVHFSTACPGTFSLTKYLECKVEMRTFGAGPWNRINFLSHKAENQTIYLSDIYVAEADPVAPTATPAAVQTKTVTATVTQVSTVTNQLPASTITQVSTVTTELPASTSTVTAAPITVTTTSSTTVSTTVTATATVTPPGTHCLRDCDKKVGPFCNGDAKCKNVGLLNLCVPEREDDVI